MMKYLQPVIKYALLTVHILLETGSFEDNLLP